jgi:hypothetical protein
MVSTEAPPTAEQIAVRAQELKVLHLALSLSLASVLDPALPVLATELRRMDLPPDGDFPVYLFHEDGGPGKECLSFSARWIFTAATTLRGESVSDLMSLSMINAATVIGDMIQKGGHGRTDVPLLQFARHFRNACGHGDRRCCVGDEQADPRYGGAVQIARASSVKLASSRRQGSVSKPSS